MILSTNHLEFYKHKDIHDEANEYLDILQDSPLKIRDHNKRVEDIIMKILNHIKLNATEIENTLYAATYHDVGKIKDGQMTDYQDHPRYGHDMIIQYLGEDCAEIILQHHEKIDGTGFPNGLKGDDIRLEAKILSVANAYDHLLNDQKLSQDECIKELKKGVGHDFDKDVVDALIMTLGE